MELELAPQKKERASALVLYSTTTTTTQLTTGCGGEGPENATQNKKGTRARERERAPQVAEGDCKARGAEPAAEYAAAFEYTSVRIKRAAARARACRAARGAFPLSIQHTPTPHRTSAARAKKARPAF